MSWVSAVAWIEAVRGVVIGHIHLVTADRQTLCGKTLGDDWISRPSGLFFKRNVLKHGDGDLCQVCLTESGGRGPISRKGSRPHG